MNSPPLPDKVVAMDSALTRVRVAHAFGGALALAYYAEPRATIDIDVNVFIPPSAHERAEEGLAPLGVKPGDPARLIRDGQARWRWDQTPVDLFFSNDAIHGAMEQWTRRVPFGDVQIPILAPEHLLICKVAYDRPKDWLDIEQMLLLNPDLDQDEVSCWLDRMLAPADPRRERLAELLSRGGPP